MSAIGVRVFVSGSLYDLSNSSIWSCSQGFPAEHSSDCNAYKKINYVKTRNISQNIRPKVKYSQGQILTLWSFLMQNPVCFSSEKGKTQISI